MKSCVERHLPAAPFALALLLAGIAPAFAADPAYTEPSPPADRWQFSFTPYGWMTNVNGDATARGHTVDID